MTLEPTKTKLVEFGRFADKYASKRGRKRPETIYFLGFTLASHTRLPDDAGQGSKPEFGMIWYRHGRGRTPGSFLHHDVAATLSNS